jgi:ribosomal-protein-alanine N-acetyltransferase
LALADEGLHDENPLSMIVLQTDRLVLRHFRSEDLESLYVLYRDPEMRKYYPDGTRTRAETLAELEWFMNGHREHPELGLWATLDRQTGEFLGRCGLLHWTMEGQAEIEVAYMIDKKRWRQGLATEAATGIVQYAQSTLGLKRLICLVIPGNEASAGVARKLGMDFERAFTDELGTSHVYALGARGSG